MVARYTRWPRYWWTRQSLRARLTLLATALFSVAVLTGAILLIVLQRYALTRVLDQSAVKAARGIVRLDRTHNLPQNALPQVAGIAGIQVVTSDNLVRNATQGADFVNPLLNRNELQQVRDGAAIEISAPSSEARWRVLGRPAGSDTVVVATDLARVGDTQRVLTEAALIGGPLAVLLMAVATYGVVALTFRSVAELRHGAADITAAGLAEQRLPVPRAQDEIHRLAVTLNAMLDRIDSATSRQRTFVGDAAHELRSPLASLRVQLEVAQRLGPDADWNELIDDVLVDVDRLDRLVEDLLALARLDEGGAKGRREPVDLTELAGSVAHGYVHSRVPVTVTAAPVTVQGDPDALRRVVINLVSNAMRYATTGVSVDVKTGTHSGQPVGVITVEDDGPGIPEAERQKVFDRFYRVQESRSRETGGTGLGLPIVRDIVRNHAGRVRLAGRADGAPGLRAIVELPVH